MSFLHFTHFINNNMLIECISVQKNSFHGSSSFQQFTPFTCSHTHTRPLTCSTDPPCPTLMELLWLSVSLRDTSIWNSGAWNQTLTHTRVNGDTFRYYDLNMTSDLEDFPSSSSSCCLCGEAGNCALSSFLTVQNTL